MQYPSSLQKLQKFQNKCMNLIQSGTMAIESKYKINKILQIKEILLLENCKLGYKLINKLLPMNIDKTLQTDHMTNTLTQKHRYNTRHKLLQNTPLESVFEQFW